MHIKPGVFFAADQSEGVLMDLNTSKYLGIDSVGAKLWAGLQANRSVDDLAREIEFAGPNPRELVLRQMRAWRSSGLIDDHEEPIPATMPQARATELAIDDLDKGRLTDTPVSLGPLIHMLHATVWTKLRMRFGRLPATLRRLQHVDVRSRAAAPDPTEILYQTVRAYRATRMLFSEGRLDCLPRSISLALALRRQRIDALVCFGVRKFPFAAHAWVQRGGCVLNDTLDHARAFTPLVTF